METLVFAVEMKTDGNRGEIEIYDTIGESFFGESLTAKEFRSRLTGLGDVSEIDVHLNSRGGSVWDGMAIYNALKDHPASVTIHIEGVAASIASVIAMAGDKRKIAENAFVMIHNPQGVTIGDAKLHRSAVTMLEKIETSAVNLYASRTSQSADRIRSWMDEETWFTAEEAVEFGFADEVTANKAKPMATVATSTMESFRNIPPAAKTLVSMSGFAPVSSYRAEYEKNRKVHDALGVTLDQYVEQRMIEDGHKPQPSLMAGFDGVGDRPRTAAMGSGYWPHDNPIYKN